MTDRSGGDGSRRPTKAERKEQARLEREQIQRQMAARKRNRTIGIAAIVVAALVVAGVIVMTQGGGAGSAAGADDPDELLEQAAAATKAAGCDAVKTIGFYDGVSDTASPDYTDQAHIGQDQRFPEPPRLSSYPSIPPTSGPHAAIPPGPLAAGVYDAPPDITRVLHSLEHGATVVWYNPDVSGPELDRLKAFYSQKLSDAEVGQDRVIVAPYEYPGEGGQLPAGVSMALTAWHRLQNCAQVDLAVAFDFTSQFSAPPAFDRDYAGEAPEAGSAL